jgi:hypothetical protein
VPSAVNAIEVTVLAAIRLELVIVAVDKQDGAG